MSLWLITHEACEAHDTGPGHPESPARLAAVLEALEHPEFAALHRVAAERATNEALHRAHDPAYVAATLAAIPSDRLLPLDGDTIISPGSGEAALRAAGALCQAVDAVMAGHTQRVFCAVRPPGHHAEHDRAMGFCLFNNVAVGALHARHVHGVSRIAVVDFDVHHGNGTQHILGGREGFFYGSSHQSPLFPGTGERSENRRGAIYNVPLPAGTGSTAFRAAFHDGVIAPLIEFAPELLFVSAGFDAHGADPLAGMELTEDDFVWVTEEILNVAERHTGGRVISTLEGGYRLETLARSVAAHVRAL